MISSKNTKTSLNRALRRKKNFDIYFSAWREHQFVLETQAGAHLEFSAPTILGILLDASHTNFFALSLLGCFTFAGNKIANGRAFGELNSQGYAKIRISVIFTVYSLLENTEAECCCSARSHIFSTGRLQCAIENQVTFATIAGACELHIFCPNSPL